jgi:DNA polymerase
MERVHFDFETYSECNIFDAGAWAYAAHPSTRVLCIGYAYGDEAPQLWTPGDEYPDFMTYTRKYTLHAWNSFFEWVIWTHVMKLPTPPISQWHDTAALSCAMALPRALGQCGIAMGMGDDVIKNKRGKELINLLSKPHKRNGEPELLQEMYDYCKQDVVAERALSKVLFPLTETERKIFMLDQEINIRGVRVDVPNVDKALTIYELAQADIRQQLIVLTGLENPGSPKQFLDWLVDHGVIIDNCQKPTLKALLDEADTYNTHAAIRLRLRLAKTAPKKFQSIRTRVGNGTRLHGNIVYHAASTGRWASVGVNLQNIARPTLDPASCIEALHAGTLDVFEMIDMCPIEALTSSIRGMLIPSKGKKFIIGDYASIEARMLAWLAGQEDKLEVFRGHGKMYEHAASKIFHIEIDEVTKDQRFLGKISELACGYGGGSGAFRTMAEAYGADISKGEGEKIKREWRAANPMITDYWSLVESAAVGAILKRKVFPALGVEFVVKNNFLWCKLPSGRPLAYHRPDVTYKRLLRYQQPGKDGCPDMQIMYSEMDYASVAEFIAESRHYGTKATPFVVPQIGFWGVNSKTRKWCEMNTYGGKLVENICQAASRDVMAESMLLLEEAGYKIVLTVHDEIIVEVDDDDETRTVEDFTRIMETVPSWAEGLPIKVEAYEADRYRK